MSSSTAPWIDAPLLGFDTETTGTNVASDRIVTVALVHSVGPGRENETVATWLIDPGVEIPEPAQRVHGISTAHAREHGMQPAEALDEVAALIVEALAKDVPLVAFNIGFDLAILQNELSRLGLPTLTERLGHDIAPVIDGLVIDRGVDRYRKGKRTLTDVLAHYGLEQDGRLHTADVDVSATLDVVRAIAEKYPQVAGSTLADLHREQMGWHLRWAEGMNEWLTKKGKTPDVNTAWPL